MQKHRPQKRTTRHLLTFAEIKGSVTDTDPFYSQVLRYGRFPDGTEDQAFAKAKEKWNLACAYDMLVFQASCMQPMRKTHWEIETIAGLSKLKLVNPGEFDWVPSERKLTKLRDAGRVPSESELDKARDAWLEAFRLWPNDNARKRAGRFICCALNDDGSASEEGRRLEIRLRELRGELEARGRKSKSRGTSVGKPMLPADVPSQGRLVAMSTKKLRQNLDRLISEVEREKRCPTHYIRYLELQREANRAAAAKSERKRIADQVLRLIQPKKRESSDDLQICRGFDICYMYARQLKEKRLRRGRSRSVAELRALDIIHHEPQFATFLSPNGAYEDKFSALANLLRESPYDIAAKLSGKLLGYNYKTVLRKIKKTGRPHRLQHATDNT